MSVYIKEKARYFHECMESILRQTLLPDEIVIVKDGPVSDELEHEIQYYKGIMDIPLILVPLPCNKGLGLALAEGIRHCNYELIARMDTDDICVLERFEKQILEFKKDPSIDIVGSHIKEFDGNITNVISKRKVPLCNDDIRKYQKRRSAFNHMTVMYKKEAVLNAGNYKDALLMEDDLLWCEMMKNGAKGKNIDDYLVFVRTGSAMIARRGGLDYFKKYERGRRKILQTGYIGYRDYFVTLMVQLVVSMMPENMRYLAFKHLLREKEIN